MQTPLPSEAPGALVEKKVIRIRSANAAKPETKAKAKPKYDCSQCPGYCCSYDRIEVKPADIKRLAKHFSLSVDEAQKKFTRLWEPGERILRHQKDEIYGTICRFFDLQERRCTIYKARPAVCREYPDGNKCGYYDFLKFERKHQGDDTFIPSA